LDKGIKEAKAEFNERINKLNAKNQAIALFPINGKLQILERVFVSVDDSGFTPAVNYIELFGKDEVTNKDVYERFKP
jgi:hypothetical protein